MSDFMAEAKYTKFDFRWGSVPDPAGGACSAPRSLAVLRDLLLSSKERRRGAELRKRRWKGREREGEKGMGGEGRGKGRKRGK